MDKLLWKMAYIPYQFKRKFLFYFYVNVSQRKERVRRERKGEEMFESIFL